MRCGLLLALAVALVGCGKDPFASAAADLPAAKARAKKLGLALTAGELVRNVPVSQNSAKEYNEAIRLTKELKAEAKVIRDAAPLFRQGRRVTDAELVETRRALAKFRPVFAQIEAGAKKPHCDFERDYSQGMALLYPELAAMKEQGRAIATVMSVAAHDGDAATVQRHLHSLSSLVRHCGEESSLIGKLVTIALSSNCLRGIEDSATQAQGNPQVLQVLLRGMDRLPSTFSYKESLRTEAVISDIAIRQIAAEAEFADKLLSTEGTKPPRHVQDAINAAKRADKKVLGDALAARSLDSFSDLTEDIQAAKTTAQLAEAWKRRDDAMGTAKDPASSILSLLGPPIGQAAVAVRRNEYRFAAVRAGLLLLIHRPRPFPSTEQALPADVRAAFNKEGLTYSVNGAGFIIEPKAMDVQTDNPLPRRSVAFVFPSQTLPSP